MSTIDISGTGVRLVLTQAVGKVRIADNSGNHIRKPTKEGKNESSNFVEWMITNDEIKDLIDFYLDGSEKKALKEKINKISDYLQGSRFALREASKEKLDEVFLGFNVYKYKEDFYSFEKKLASNIIIRLTFKMGDFTLAVHMFVLLPFDCETMTLFNPTGEIPKNGYLGSGAYAMWRPSKDDVVSIVEGLANASENHKNALIEML